ncbi:hypothetical protein [Actinomadura sp. 9N407]|uniref:hypothetical protein n=1 Tax=Actinomadura sp. 9N407 TaxID=3375154 RepID=UPI00379534C9
MTATWRDRFQTAPLWVCFLYFSIFGPLAAGFGWLAIPDVDSISVLLALVVGGPAFAGLATAWPAAVSITTMAAALVQAFRDLTKFDRLETAINIRLRELPD